jgi:dTDP-4-amino-4,6-dideoxygalactose transaminase
MVKLKLEVALIVIVLFYPVKHLTTGEGGAITTNSKATRTHGMNRNESMARDEKGNVNPWYYEMHSLGFNY